MFNCFEFWKTHEEWCDANCPGNSEGDNCAIGKKKLEEENKLKSKLKTGLHVKLTACNIGGCPISYEVITPKLEELKIGMRIKLTHEYIGCPKDTVGSIQNGETCPEKIYSDKPYWFVPDNPVGFIKVYCISELYSKYLKGEEPKFFEILPEPKPKKEEKVTQFKVGDRVEHIHQGKGTVVYVTKTGATVHVKLDSGKEGSGIGGSWNTLDSLLTLLPDQTPQEKQGEPMKIVGRKVVRDGVNGRIIDSFSGIKSYFDLPANYLDICNTSSVVYMFEDNLRIWDKASHIDWCVGQFIPETEWTKWIKIIEEAGERLHKINAKLKEKKEVPFEEKI